MPWQYRLFELFISAKFPAELDLPTGLGKTSVMAIWLLARAVAEKDALKAIPRRLVYIVDRCAVVDQATEEAEKLRNALNCDITHESKAEHLKKLAPDKMEQAFAELRAMKADLDLGDRAKLPISTLRGKNVDNREWLDDPATPAIIVGTVDMIGSRLLFEGYGISSNMRPYHAGLLGADTLVVLDEAHLVPPFEALLRQIADGKSEFGPNVDAEPKIVPEFKLLSLSATGRAQASSDDSASKGVFRLEDDDLCNTIVKERLSAPKFLDFVKIGDERDALAEMLAQQAWMLSGEGKKPVRCLVYCDSRDVAEKVKGRLDKLLDCDKKTAGTERNPELFVGARRIREREGAKAWLEKYGFLAGSPQPESSAFLIATSAGEVGIDLDADHMVCDLVPWGSMVQRLGRVNRRGRGVARVAIVHGDEPKPKKPDAPTDHEKRQAVAYRSLAVFEELPIVDGYREASPGALRELKLRAETDETLRKKIEQATTPEPLHPALTRALVDAWSMTSLKIHTGRPEVSPWLCGWVEEEPQTTVIWRTYLPVREDIAEWPRNSAEKKEIEAFFEAAPSHESEKLETETYRVVEWLQDRARAMLERKPASDEKDEGAVVLFVLLPDGSYATHYTLERLAKERKSRAKEDFLNELIGKILIVDARLGGLKDGLLDIKASNGFPTADLDDGWGKCVGFRVRQATSNDDKSNGGDWHFEDDFVLRTNGEGDAEEWLVVEHLKNAAQSENGRSISEPQMLADHQNLAELKAKNIAIKLGLSGDAAEALAVAACLHDEGKQAPRWQRAFRASRDARKFGLSGPLAKTRGPIDQGILDGYRHEFGSLPYAEADARFKALPHDWQDLVLHLIAAHHGQARPVIRTRGCEDAPPSALEGRAREVALRFARMQRRWGPWGLAWWEALLRAADQQASRDNDSSNLDTSHTDEK